MPSSTTSRTPSARAVSASASISAICSSVRSAMVSQPRRLATSGVPAGAHTVASAPPSRARAQPLGHALVHRQRELPLNRRLQRHRDVGLDGQGSGVAHGTIVVAEALLYVSGAPRRGSSQPAVRPARPTAIRDGRPIVSPHAHPTVDPTPQLPDRNLALELVRVTEAAALAAAPLVGHGRQGGGRPGRGRRHALHAPLGADGRRRGDRRGREGRGADALQRRADRRRLAAAGRHRRRSARGHDARRARDAERARGDRAVEPRHDVRPGTVRVHGEDGRRARDRRPARPRPPARRDRQAGGRAQGLRGRRRDGRGARPSPPRAGHRRDPRRPARACG